MSLLADGFEIVPGSIKDAVLDQLRDTVFREDSAGERSLLDLPLVRSTAIDLKNQLIESGHLASGAIAIQAIAFDKTAAINWKVSWHQDVMFPFAKRVSSEGFDIPSLKQGIHYARPPVGILAQLLAVRLHLDDCTASNGPLRISPGTHTSGILPSREVLSQVAIHGEIACMVNKGGLLLMKPLAVHTSSKAAEPKHRRVLHFVYNTGDIIPEPWHREI